jgi:predicted GNAT family acetyltransferase
VGGTERSNDVVDDVAHHRFVLAQDGARAQLVYRLNGNQLVLVHTEVPEQLAGRGIGGRLVRAAVDRAAADGLTVLPSCPYARKWLQDHPDAAATVHLD